MECVVEATKAVAEAEDEEDPVGMAPIVCVRRRAAILASA